MIGPVAVKGRAAVLGEAHALLAAVLGEAHALLHLIDFDEPFGYSVVEAMACGTPVVAYDRGSMAELLDHGSTGFLTSDAAGAVAAVDAALGLDRRAIREATRSRFSRAAMVAKYLAVYESVLDGNAVLQRRES